MKQKSRGFTLAEVLITLGVIGVVAAITLPTLIQQHNKLVWTNQLKETYSIFSQAFQKMMADDGVNDLADTEVFRAMQNNCRYDSGIDTEECSKFYQLLKKYIKINDITTIQNYKGHTLNGSAYSPRGTVIVLANGSIIHTFAFRNYDEVKDCNLIKSLGGKMCKTLGNLLIDMNGYKKPNMYGRDIFVFKINSTGALEPVYSKDYAIYANQVDLSSNSDYWRIGNQCDAADTSEVSGQGCAARIIENGWKMDY